MDYIGESIYQIYFFNNQRIDIIQNLEFNESYDYKEITIIVEKELLFSFPNLELLSDSTFNTLIRDKELTATSSITLAVHFTENNSDPFSTYFLEDNFPSSPQK